jgi:hypothetical protein
LGQQSEAKSKDINNPESDPKLPYKEPSGHAVLLDWCDPETQPQATSILTFQAGPLFFYSPGLSLSPRRLTAFALASGDMAETTSILRRPQV